MRSLATQRPGDSDLLLYVKATPPVPGARVGWRIFVGATRVVDNGTGTTVLDADGKASWTIGIDDYDFLVEITVKTPDGSQILS